MPLPVHPLLSKPSSTNNSEVSAEEFLLPKALLASSVKPALNLVKPLSSSVDWLAEIIHIIRPLVYGTHDHAFDLFVPDS